MASSSSSFVLPTIHDDATGSWGPSAASIPQRFLDVPYAPYSKSDKITHIADWVAETSTDPKDIAHAARLAQRQQQQAGRGPGGRGREAYGASAAGQQFGYVHDEDEASFSVVDTGRAAAISQRGRSSGLLPNRGGGRGRGGAGGARGGAAGGRGGYGGRGGNLNAAFGASARGGYQDRRGGGGGFGGRGGRAGGWGGQWGEPQRVRESSVTIGSDWQMLEEVSFARLQKLSLPLASAEPEELSTHGTIFGYDKRFDSVNARAGQPLKVVDMLRYNPTTSDDPVMASMAARGEATVYATDAVLAVLMAAPRSVNSWDIVIRREGDAVFLDKREGGAFDFVTVNENAIDPPADVDEQHGSQINSPAALSLEATYVNQNFACQVLDESKRKAFKQPNPFYSADENEPLASCAFRYRKFDLSLPDDSAGGDEEGATKKGVKLVVRAEVDGYQGKKDQYITVHALNEFDPKAQGSGKAPDWRTKLDSQRGAVVATEMKNNSVKLARWTIRALLAGAELMKLGFVSRANPKVPEKHVILGMLSLKPKEFAAQMNISLANGWGIVRTIADLALSQPEGRYVLVKDPNSPVLRFYSVPDNAFDPIEEQEEEVQEEDDEDDE